MLCQINKFEKFFIENKFQAYAELETDTPGQILGVTLKTDGKSNKSSSSNDNNDTKFWSKQTQGERTSDYEEHDRSNDAQHQKDKEIDTKIYFTAGALIIIGIFFYLNDYMQRKRYEYQPFDDEFERQETQRLKDQEKFKHA